MSGYRSTTIRKALEALAAEGGGEGEVFRSLEAYREEIFAMYEVRCVSDESLEVVTKECRRVRDPQV